MVCTGSGVPRMYSLIGILAVSCISAVIFLSSQSHNSSDELLQRSWLSQYYGYKPQLMDEGSITMDPGSVEDPAKEFFRMNEASTQTDEDVPDAGPGHVLGGWTHPELVQPPNPAELQSFEDPTSHSAVYSDNDYVRTPGAVDTVESTRSSIAALQQQIAATHAEAEDAKRVYEAEKLRSKQLQTEYLKYVREMKDARQKYGAMAGSQARSGVSMWDANAMAPSGSPHGEAEPIAGDQQFVIDENTPDAADFYRKHVYEGSEAQPTLAEVGAKRATQQALALSPYATAREEGNQNEVARERAAEENAIRQHSIKVELAEDVARLQLARRRLAAAISRPSVLKGPAMTVREFCPEGTPGCQQSVTEEPTRRSSFGAVGRQSERAMQTAGDRQVPLGDAVHQQPRWFGDDFAH